ncbi:hypothetical protein HanHA89_Chr15g0596471 [Helianthus annuus]|nr:hypothetical protein HanHA89_Chr15g0596471 [Helianthus annuus]
MELQFQTITMLILLVTFLWSRVDSQSLLNDTETKTARLLDAVLQDYAYRAFITPKTGISFNGSVPNNLTGIQISALRLRSGSLFTRGVPVYQEFKIPTGVIAQPYVERLVFVYHNFGNWSSFYYPLPGYIYLAPVLGLLAYNGSDLSARNLTELDIRASDEPISIEFGSVKPAPDGSKSNPMCVSVDLHGQVNFTNVVSGNKCLTFKQGHFSIVVKSKSKANPPSAPVSPSLVPPATSEIVKPDKGFRISSKVWVYVIYVVGGFVVLGWLVLLVLWVQGCKKRKMMHKMERAAEGGEQLHMTMVGSMKAPVAMVTRTQPTLETEHAP